jgi:hypothetical protein
MAFYLSHLLELSQVYASASLLSLILTLRISSYANENLKSLFIIWTPLGILWVHKSLTWNRLTTSGSLLIWNVQSPKMSYLRQCTGWSPFTNVFVINDTTINGVMNLVKYFILYNGELINIKIKDNNEAEAYTCESSSKCDK